MGKTPNPVHILVLDDDLFLSDEIQALIAKGHPIECGVGECPDVGAYDLILGRRAWYLDTKHLKYIDTALKAARTRAVNRKEKA